MDECIPLHNIRDQITAVAKKTNRDPSSITLVGISKKKSVSLILSAHHAGLEDIGESYVQEFLSKWKELESTPVRWHFVGHLQRRKARDIVGKIHLIHSLDSMELADEINKRAEQQKITQKCLIQINLGREQSKSGIPSHNAATLLRDLTTMNHLEVLGLMTLPPFFEDSEKVRPFFRLLRELRDLLNAQKTYRTPLTELSMGMSHDFIVAIEEGATIIRVGEALFGKRGTADQGPGTRDHRS